MGLISLRMPASPQTFSNVCTHSGSAIESQNRWRIVCRLIIYPIFGSHKLGTQKNARDRGRTWLDKTIDVSRIMWPVLEKKGAKNRQIIHLNQKRVDNKIGVGAEKKNSRDPDTTHTKNTKHWDLWWLKTQRSSPEIKLIWLWSQCEIHKRTLRVALAAKIAGTTQASVLDRCPDPKNEQSKLSCLLCLWVSIISTGRAHQYRCNVARHKCKWRSRT